MTVLGKIITCMAKERIPGVMGASMKVNTTWTRSMAMVFTSGQMVEGTKATGKMENNTERENTFLQTAMSKLGIGKMEKEPNGSLRQIEIKEMIFHFMKLYGNLLLLYL